jgi:hypothetical protein
VCSSDLLSADLLPFDRLTWNGSIQAGPFNGTYEDDPPIPLLFEIELSNVPGDRTVDFEFNSKSGDEPRERRLDLGGVTAALAPPLPSPTPVTRMDMAVGVPFLVPLVVFAVAFVVALAVAILRYGICRRAREPAVEDDSAFSRSTGLSSMRRSSGSMK